MRADLMRELRRALERAEAVAVATVVSGPGLGRQLVIWDAGHTRGDLGRPRLNQRAALHAETLFEKGPRSGRKSFEIQGTLITVHFEFRDFPVRPQAGSAGRATAP